MTKAKPVRDFLERDENSVTDTEAGKILAAALPSAWVDNVIHKDYAKDHHIEIAVPVTVKENGSRTKERTTRKVTGKTIYVQRKGVDGAVFRHGGTVVAYPLELRHLTYWADEAPLPVFLIVVDIRTRKIYWLFMQEYLSADYSWRKKVEPTVHIPVGNDLSDFGKFEKEVDRAINYTRVLRGGSVRETVDANVKRLQKMDERFKVEPRITGRTEEYIFLANEPVSFALTLNGGGPSSALKLADLIDRGLPVSFARGEITIAGSPIFQDFNEAGGTLRVAHDFDGTATLACLDSNGTEVRKWEDLPGMYRGGRTEHHFESSLPNAPFRVQAGPCRSDLPGSINVSANPVIWLDQRLRSVGYFDRTYAFFKDLIENPRIALEAYHQGNRFFRAVVDLRDAQKMRPFVAFLEIMRKARRVAEYFGIDPVCAEENLSGADNLRDIEITHDVLFADGYKYKYANAVVNITLDKSEVARIADTERELHDLVLYTDDDYSYPFMGVPIMMGRLALCLTDAKMNVGLKELKRRIRRAKGSSLEVSYTCSATSKYSIHRPTPEELRD